MVLTAPFFFLLFTSFEGGDIFKLDSLGDILPQEWTFQAYTELFTTMPLMARFFGNTLLVCLIAVSSEVILASMAAYPLARWKFKGKTLILSILLLTMLLPAQANMLINFMTIRGLGLYDTLIAVILPGSVTIFGIFLMRQAFLVVPKELEEAAYLDGCNAWQIFWRVMLPVVRPAIGTLSLFSFVAHWNSFMWPLVVLKSRELFPLSVGLSTLSEAFDSQFRIVAAGSILATLPLLFLFVILQRQFVSGLTKGAVK